jgi:hypothetical protein
MECIKRISEALVPWKDAFKYVQEAGLWKPYNFLCLVLFKHAIFSWANDYLYW